ncbi:MAG: anti-sigma factor family protein, partial [Planctomycetota bacterium]
MIDVTSELLSRYADGEASADERAAVEEALRDSPTLQLDLEDFQTLSALFGTVEGEEVSEELRARLYGLRPVPQLQRFQALPGSAPVRRGSWAAWAAGLAAALLVGVGVVRLAHRPEVVLVDVVVQRLHPDGSVAGTRRVDVQRKRAGESVVAEAAERVSFRLEDGAEVVLLPGSSAR